MTLDEARKVASVVRWADDGCPTCVRKLVGDLTKEFPEYKWLVGRDADGDLDVLVEPAAGTEKPAADEPGGLELRNTDG